MLGLIRRRPVLSFAALAFFVTYAVGLPWAMLTQDLETSLGWRDELLSLVFMRGGPTIAGLSVVAIIAGRRGLAIWLTQILRWQVAPGFYLAMLFIAIVPFAATTLVLFSPAELAAAPDLVAGRDWAAIAWSYVQESAYVTVTNGEETGWRFAMLGLLLARMRALPATIIVGMIWALWHMPAFFLFGQAPLWYPLIGICLALSILYAWLYLRTSSLLVVLLAHGCGNAAYYTFERHFAGLSADYDAAAPLGDWIFAGLALGLALIVLIAEWRLFNGVPRVRAGEMWADVGRGHPADAGGAAP